MNNYKGTTTKFQKNESIFDDQIRWEQLKEKIGKYLTLFSVSEAKKKKNEEMNTFKENFTKNGSN